MRREQPKVRVNLASRRPYVLFSRARHHSLCPLLAPSPALVEHCDSSESACCGLRCSLIAERSLSFSC